MFDEPRVADLDLAAVEGALLRAAVGDYAAEAAVLLLANDGHWLPRLQAAGLITIALDGDAVDGGPWAAVLWPDLDAALTRAHHRHRQPAASAAGRRQPRRRS
ncbi:hypothetical protein A7K94_0201755, partial [Modestobacter sp. VKM Ac-2676]